MGEVYKLFYFPYRGIGEAIRYIFAQAGVRYEDNRLSSQEWESISEYTPMKSLPVLEVDGRKMAQAIAIARYVAQTFHLGGRNNLENALCDMYAEQIMTEGNRIIEPVNQFLVYGQNETAVATFQRLKDTELASLLRPFEKALSENSSGWLIWKKLTWTDIVTAEFTDRLMTCYDQTTLDDYPRLRDHMEKVHSQPNIQMYISSRPTSQM